MKFSEVLIELWGDAFKDKLKESGGFTMSDIDNRVKATLFEVDFWAPRVVNTPNGFNIEAIESDPTFFISLASLGDGRYGIKFDDVGGEYKWETNKLLIIKKTQFLQSAAKKILGPKFVNGEINTLVFAPESSDGMEEKRVTLFDRLVKELQETIKVGSFIFDKEDSNNQFNGAMSLTYKNQL